MNQWLRVALYAFMGIIMGSLLLGTIAPGLGTGFAGNGSMYGDYGNTSPYVSGYDTVNGQMPMHGGMGMRGGMGMHRR